MTLPSLIFGVILSSLYGAAFHLIRGGGFGKLVLYIILGWVGFWTGHFIASQLGWTFASVGPLHLGSATLFSLLFLLVGHWLSLVEIQKR
jgi:uncharacterized membrane protein YeaQ/YmgE (transglycosylase-associated protein family)